MKLLSILLLSLLPFLVSAQTDSSAKQFELTHIFSVENISADSLYFIFLNHISTNKDSLFFSNDNIKNRKWALGRAGVLDKDYKSPGYLYEYRGNNAFVTKFVICYEVRKNEPIEFLTIQGDLLFQFKDNRVKITPSNLKYTNKNIGAPPVYKKIYGMGRSQCNESGTFNDLLNCEYVPLVTQNIKSFTESSITRYFSNIEYFSKNLSGTKYKATNLPFNDNW